MIEFRRNRVMEYIQSKDGIRIAFEKRGQGPPLVLIHGAASDHSRWMPILPKLEQQFTVYAIDRRGRGKSGDTQSYSIGCECDDVIAIVDSIPGPVNLLGHSYGAICSLEASLKAKNLRKLILYEPPIQTVIQKDDPNHALDRVKECLREGHREKALLIFLKEIVGIPPHEILVLRSLPNWPLRIATAHTLPREEESVRSYVFQPERFSNMETPTLLLLGSDSPSFFKEATKALHESLPNCKLRILPGQQHAAMDTAPEIFLKEVIEFLMEK